MEELEQKALEFLKNRDYEKAAKLYLQLAVQFPQTEKFLIAAGNCYDCLGDKKVALGLYRKALNINPQALPALINIATIYYELKKYEKVVEFSTSALEINPDNFSALLNLGNAHYAQGHYEDALVYYRKMHKLNPNSYNALLNLANTYYNLAKFKEALQFARIAIEKRPTSSEAYIIAGNSLIELTNNDEASSCLKKAAELSPDSYWLCSSLANLFQKMGNWKQCLYYAWRVFSLKGKNVSADDHISFAYFLYEVLDEKADEECRILVHKYLERWEKAYPDNPIVHHACAALRNEQNVQTMDLFYVKNLFDGFALSFDEILTELDYEVPTLIAEAVKDNLKTKIFNKRRILDLGCGTGLCAQALKKYFPNEEFHGVDISEKMLNVAGQKNLYKELYATDILSFLENNETVYHAVVSGDVLTYMGDLKPLFRKLVGAIKFNGFFCFSITKNTDNNNDYFLTPSGRFVHTLAYVQRLLTYSGLKTLSVKETVLRHEGAKEVIGYIILTQKEVEVVFE